MTEEENIEEFKESCREIYGELTANIDETEFSCKVKSKNVDTLIEYRPEAQHPSTQRRIQRPDIEIHTKVLLSNDPHGIPTSYDIVGKLYGVEKIRVEEEPADEGVAFPSEMEITAESGSATISEHGLKEFRIGEK